MNCLAHIPRNFDWYDDYRAARGADALRTYVNSVYGFLYSMPPDSFFRIEGHVTADNIDLFIKVCCMFIDEYEHIPQRTDFFVFNSQADVIRRISLPPIKKPNSNCNNEK
jgi:hypothetical protein